VDAAFALPERHGSGIHIVSTQRNRRGLPAGVNLRGSGAGRLLLYRSLVDLLDR
jgi:hypothetical protein